jgi:hypothetical protein
MIQESAKKDELEDQKCPDCDGSEKAEELRKGSKPTRSVDTQ